MDITLYNVKYQLVSLIIQEVLFCWGFFWGGHIWLCLGFTPVSVLRGRFWLGFWDIGFLEFEPGSDVCKELQAPQFIPYKGSSDADLYKLMLSALQNKLSRDKNLKKCKGSFFFEYMEIKTTIHVQYFDTVVFQSLTLQK